MTRPTTRAGRAEYDRVNRAARARAQRAAEARVVLDRLYRPGVDDEPAVRAELWDLDGTLWVKHPVPGGGWHPEAEPEYELKWSSRALADLGPFYGPPRRDPQVALGMRTRAAAARPDSTGRGPLPSP